MKEEKIHCEDKCIMCGKIINRNPYIKPPQPCPECQAKPEQRQESEEESIVIMHCQGSDYVDLIEYEKLKNRLEAAEKELKAYQAGNVPVAQIIADNEGMALDLESMEEEIQQQAERIGRLKQALKKYGRHTDECGIDVESATIGELSSNESTFKAEYKCTCGFEQALEKED